VEIYERHQLEKSILYQTVARAWPKISLEYAVEAETTPLHGQAEFERKKSRKFRRLRRLDSYALIQPKNLQSATSLGV